MPACDYERVFRGLDLESMKRELVDARAQYDDASAKAHQAQINKNIATERLSEAQAAFDSLMNHLSDHYSPDGTPWGMSRKDRSVDPPVLAPSDVNVTAS